MYIHLLAGVRGGRQDDSGQPLLQRGGVTGLDQQRRGGGGGVLNGPGSVNRSVGLYPEVGRVAAFEAHRAPPATVDKRHCGRRRNTKNKLAPKWERNLEVKLALETKEAGDRQPDTEGQPKVF